jgi:NAD binding domain of 6-phosphogluconate dehydrogenase
MPDQESALHPVWAVKPVTKDLRTAPSNSARSPEKRLVGGRVEFIGLGRMGIVATKLVRSGCAVTGFVRSPERLKELSALGTVPSVEIADVFVPFDERVTSTTVGRDRRQHIG